jgi:hypothetical protein
MRLAWGIAVVLVLTGCPGTFEGAVGGHSLKVKSSAFSFDVQGDHGVAIALCPEPSAGSGRLQLTLRFTAIGLDGTLPTHGDFPIGHHGPLGKADAEFWVPDETGERFDSLADLGSVTLSTLSVDHAAGSFWLIFGSDRVRGTFDASPSSGDSRYAGCE